MDRESSPDDSPYSSQYNEAPLPFGRIRIDPGHPDYDTKPAILGTPSPYHTHLPVMPSPQHQQRQKHRDMLATENALRLARASADRIHQTIGLPSPPSKAPLIVDVGECFRSEDREEFRRMLHDPKHVNAMRIDAAKQRRILHYLRTPNAAATRGQSAKEKFEARKKWMMRDGDGDGIYRQPSAKFPGVRKLVVEEDAFDVIAREHLKLGHWGRNRLQKHVAEQFYGVSREEIQWVIDRCLQCGPKRQKHHGSKRQDMIEDDGQPESSTGLMHTPTFTPGV